MLIVSGKMEAPFSLEQTEYDFFVSWILSIDKCSIFNLTYPDAAYLILCQVTFEVETIPLSSM